MLTKLIKFSVDKYSSEYWEGIQYFITLSFLPKYRLMLEVDIDSIFIELSETFSKTEQRREVCALSFRKPFLK